MNGVRKNPWRCVAKQVAFIFDGCVQENWNEIEACILRIEVILNLSFVNRVRVVHEPVYWYGEIASAFHQRNTAELQFALEGMRAVVQVHLKKEIRCRKQSTNAA